MSIAALAGTPRRPGAVALAHAGVLFCEDADQLPTHARDVLRLVCDQRAVTTTGGGATATYPARVQLVLSATDCPHPTTDHGGYFRRGANHRPLAGMSVLLDRIDIHATLPAMPPPDAPRGESTTVVAARVHSARAAAAARWARQPWTTNREATGTALRAALAALPTTWFAPLRHLTDAGTLSPRAGVHVLRLAWTVADLAGHDRPTGEDMAEAIALRGVTTADTGLS